jgi:hypothetical protein
MEKRGRKSEIKFSTAQRLLSLFRSVGSRHASYFFAASHSPSPPLGRRRTVPLAHSLALETSNKAAYYCASFSKNVLVSSSVSGRILFAVRP